MTPNDAPEAPVAAPRRGIQSIGIGTAVLRAFVQASGPLHLREVARAVGMPGSKVYRYLVSFVEAGLVRQDPATGRYDLGPFAIELGLAAIGRIDDLGIVIAALDRATAETGRDAHVTVWSSRGPTVVRWKQGPTDIAIRVREGSVLPALASATGRVWICHLPPGETRALREAELARLSRELGASAAALRARYEAELAAIREHGLSRSEEERRPGVDALAGPIIGRDGTILFAMTLLGPHGSFDLAYDGPVATRFRAVLRDAARQLGARPPPSPKPLS